MHEGHGNNAVVSTSPALAAEATAQIDAASDSLTDDAAPEGTVAEGTSHHSTSLFGEIAFFVRYAFGRE